MGSKADGEEEEGDKGQRRCPMLGTWFGTGLGWACTGPPASQECSHVRAWAPPSPLLPCWTWIGIYSYI